MEFNELLKWEMGFNRKNFVEDIVNIDFEGDLALCALTLGFSEKAIKKIIFTSTNGSKDTLDKIYKYCRKTNRDPEKYIFMKQ